MIKTPSTDHYSKKDETMGERFERRIHPTLEGIFGPLTKRSDTSSSGPRVPKNSLPLLVLMAWVCRVSSVRCF